MICQRCNIEFEKTSNSQKYCSECGAIILKCRIKKYDETHKEEASKRRKEYYKIYYKNNREKLLEYQKKYSKIHKEEPKRKKYSKKYYKTHKEQHHQRMKKWREEHKKEVKEYQKKYRETNKEKLKEYYKKYQETHKEKINLYSKNKRNTNINYRILCNLRKRIWEALKHNSKSKSTMNLVGCSIEYLKQYLESKFKLGMSWDNYGKWHVDHIRPCASFDLSNLEEQRKCFNYTNLQPLWAEENLSKG